MSERDWDDSKGPLYERGAVLEKRRGENDEEKAPVEERYQEHMRVWEEIIENEGIPDSEVASFIQDGPDGVGSKSRARMIVTGRTRMKRRGCRMEEEISKSLEKKDKDPNGFRKQFLRLTGEEEVQKLAPRDPNKNPVTKGTKLYEHAVTLSEYADMNGEEVEVLGQTHYRINPYTIGRDEFERIDTKYLRSNGLIGVHPIGTVPFYKKEIYMRKDMVRSLIDDKAPDNSSR